MAESLTFEYDKTGDILYINRCTPYPEQSSEELGDEIVARLNPITGEIENLEVLFYSKRLMARERLELPIDAHFRLVSR